METADKVQSLPLTVKGVTEFLASPFVEGIGSVYARRLVDRFGTDAISVLTHSPQQAAEVAGIGTARANTASQSLSNLSQPERLLGFLFSCGIGYTFIERIIGKYRRRTAEVITGDPYSMVENVWQLSFFTADKIGKALGFAADDPRRLQGALVTAVKTFASNGHLFATPDEAVNYAAQIAGVDAAQVREQVVAVCNNGRLVESRGGLYLPVFYKAEKDGAKKLAELAATPVQQVDKAEIPRKSRNGHSYTPGQLEAIETALKYPVVVLTGGPGTGKTTVLRGIIEVLEREGKKVVLAAPTGRAAKRMTTLTGVEASTIHRLLGFRSGEGYKARQIKADTLIIDEGSMMEQVLFNHLLQALKSDTHVILVGDTNQLPAIGAGDVLRDLIKSGIVPVMHLDENFRQGEGSGIASGAKAINEGRIPRGDSGGDFIIIPEPSVKAIHNRIIELMTKELPETLHISPTEIIVVTPQQIGPLGARQLNIDLQAQLNPNGPELRRGDTIMRLGDPVMQTANSRERGVYNGETGRITSVDTERQILEVTFSDDRQSEYHRTDLSELVLAYATTVHKLQGSEVPYMIFPITMAHKPMLYRNLLYTGVSRATKLCVLVGEPQALAYAVGNAPDTTRNSNFHHRLRHP